MLAFGRVVPEPGEEGSAAYLREEKKFRNIAKVRLKKMTIVLKKNVSTSKKQLKLLQLLYYRLTAWARKGGDLGAGMRRKKDQKVGLKDGQLRMRG
jgi:hypothetical protein